MGWGDKVNIYKYPRGVEGIIEMDFLMQKSGKIRYIVKNITIL